MADIAAAVDGIVHEPTQAEGRGVDLTAAGVYEVTGAGRVDFGGGELEPAELSPRDPTKRHEDDDYGWWELDAGGYLVEYNESLSGGPFLLQPRRAVVERGASHPTLAVEELPRVPLSVSGAGLRIKENARVSTLLPR